MKEKELIELFMHRDETAISTTIEQYGKYCYSIAYNILGSHEDAEEALDDALIDVWNAIPPTVPSSFKAYLSRLTRNSAIAIYRRNHSKKRYAEADILLSEIEECLPAPDGKSHEDSISINNAINAFLSDISEDKRRIFIKRYFFGQDLTTLARDERISEKRLSVILFRLRAKLKNHLEKENILI